MKLHYYTLGTPRRDAQGHVTNASCCCTGPAAPASSSCARNLPRLCWCPAAFLDPAHYFVIMPTGIGHGGSAKPSDGLHARFPHYNYDDMVEAQYRLVSEGLNIDHLRLLFGTSMGCMHAFVWGEAHPTFADALMPMAWASAGTDCRPQPLLAQDADGRHHQRSRLAGRRL